MDKLSFNVKTTKAILVGVSDFEAFPRIDPAINNIEDFERLLTDANLLGLPKQNVTKIVNLRSDQIFDRLVDFFEDKGIVDTDALIFYYVGHGFRELRTRELYLTGTNSKKNSIHISGLPFTRIRELIETSNIQKRVVLIDACHSGLAAMDLESQRFSASELDVKGTYVLTSSAGDEKSLFDTTKRNTFFTDGFLSIVEEGLPVGKAFISLDDIFEQLQRRLARANLPRPQRRTNINAHDFYVFVKPPI